jgi:integral membrane protein (TIGR01906 family)
MTAAPTRLDRVASLPAPMRWLGAGLFVTAVPLFLVTTNVLQLAADRPVYERGFARYDVARRTGLTPAQLREVAQAFIDYFSGARPSLDVVVELGGARRPLFNQRELKHMHDVRDLILAADRWRLLAGAVLVAMPALGFAFLRSSFLAPFAKLCVAGALLTVGLLGAFAGLSLGDFGDAFVRFHELMFDNDLWILDPTRDYLIVLFPEGFWFDATIRIATSTAIQAISLGLLGVGLHLWAAG